MSLLFHTKNLGTKEFEIYLKSQPDIVQLIFSIERITKNSYGFYYESILILNKGLLLEKVKQNLTNEYQQLLNKQSFIYKINNSIQSRQRCIYRLKAGLAKIQKLLPSFKKVYFKDNLKDNLYLEYVQFQGYSPILENSQAIDPISILCDFFTHMVRLREITVYIIEEINQWKYKVEEWADRCQQHQPIFFLYQGQNYYKTLMKDVQFIWLSKLSEYIWLQDKNDPLLIRNVVKVQRKQEKEILQKYFVQIVYPKEEDMVDRIIRCLEMLVSKYIPTKITNNFQQQELLVQNYLSIQYQKINQKIKQQGNIFDNKIQENHKYRQQLGKNDRGWIFGKNIEKPVREKIRQIVERHKKIIQSNKKLFGTNNNLNKQSPIKRKFSQTYQQPLQHIKRNKSLNFKNLKGNKFQENQQEIKLYSSEGQNTNKNYDKGNQRTTMFQSLTKLSPIIYQDSNQSESETPKQNKIKITLPKFDHQNKKEMSEKLINIKLNKKNEETDRPQIIVQESQIPINTKQFMNIFKADSQRRTYKFEGIRKKKPIIYPIRQLLKSKKQDKTQEKFRRVPVSTPSRSKYNSKDDYRLGQLQ